MRRRPYRHSGILVALAAALAFSFALLNAGTVSAQSLGDALDDVFQKDGRGPTKTRTGSRGDDKVVQTWGKREVAISDEHLQGLLDAFIATGAWDPALGEDQFGYAPSPVSQAHDGLPADEEIRWKSLVDDFEAEQDKLSREHIEQLIAEYRTAGVVDENSGPDQFDYRPSEVVQKFPAYAERENTLWRGKSLDLHRELLVKKLGISGSGGGGIFIGSGGPELSPQAQADARRYLRKLMEQYERDGVWDPALGTASIPYEPSDAARRDPKVREAEEALWKQLADNFANTQIDKPQVLRGPADGGISVDPATGAALVAQDQKQADPSAGTDPASTTSPTASLGAASYKHLRQLLDRYKSEGRWDPAIGAASFPYEPSQAAQGDATLRTAEQGLWNNIVAAHAASQPGADSGQKTAPSGAAADIAGGANSQNIAGADAQSQGQDASQAADTAAHAQQKSQPDAAAQVQQQGQDANAASQPDQANVAPAATVGGNGSNVSGGADSRNAASGTNNASDAAAVNAASGSGKADQNASSASATDSTQTQTSGGTPKTRKKNEWFPNELMASSSKAKPKRPTTARKGTGKGGSGSGKGRGSGKGSGGGTGGGSGNGVGTVLGGSGGSSPTGTATTGASTSRIRTGAIDLASLQATSRSNASSSVGTTSSGRASSSSAFGANSFGGAFGGLAGSSSFGSANTGSGGFGSGGFGSGGFGSGGSGSGGSFGGLAASLGSGSPFGGMSGLSRGSKSGGVAAPRGGSRSAIGRSAARSNGSVGASRGRSNGGTATTSRAGASDGNSIGSTGSRVVSSGGSSASGGAAVSGASTKGGQDSGTFQTFSTSGTSNGGTTKGSNSGGGSSSGGGSGQGTGTGTGSNEGNGSSSVTGGRGGSADGSGGGAMQLASVGSGNNGTGSGNVTGSGSGSGIGAVGGPETGTGSRGVTAAGSGGLGGRAGAGSGNGTGRGIASSGAVFSDGQGFGGTGSAVEAKLAAAVGPSMAKTVAKMGFGSGAGGPNGSGSGHGSGLDGGSGGSAGGSSSGSAGGGFLGQLMASAGGGLGGASGGFGSTGGAAGGSGGSSGGIGGSSFSSSGGFSGGGGGAPAFGTSSLGNAMGGGSIGSGGDFSGGGASGGFGANSGGDAAPADGGTTPVDIGSASPPPAEDMAALNPDVVTDTSSGFDPVQNSPDFDAGSDGGFDDGSDGGGDGGSGDSGLGDGSDGGFDDGADGGAGSVGEIGGGNGSGDSGGGPDAGSTADAPTSDVQDSVSDQVDSSGADTDFDRANGADGESLADSGGGDNDGSGNDLGGTAGSVDSGGVADGGNDGRSDGDADLGASGNNSGGSGGDAPNDPLGGVAGNGTGEPDPDGVVGGGGDSGEYLDGVPEGADPDTFNPVVDDVAAADGADTRDIPAPDSSDTPAPNTSHVSVQDSGDSADASAQDGGDNAPSPDGPIPNEQRTDVPEAGDSQDNVPDAGDLNDSGNLLDADDERSSPEVGKQIAGELRPVEKGGEIAANEASPGSDEPPALTPQQAAGAEARGYIAAYEAGELDISKLTPEQAAVLETELRRQNEAFKMVMDDIDASMEGSHHEMTAEDMAYTVSGLAASTFEWAKGAFDAVAGSALMTADGFTKEGSRANYLLRRFGKGVEAAGDVGEAVGGIAVSAGADKLLSDGIEGGVSLFSDAPDQDGTPDSGAGSPLGGNADSSSSGANTNNSGNHVQQVERGTGGGSWSAPGAGGNINLKDAQTEIKNVNNLVKATKRGQEFTNYSATGDKKGSKIDPNSSLGKIGNYTGAAQNVSGGVKNVQNLQKHFKDYVNAKTPQQEIKAIDGFVKDGTQLVNNIRSLYEKRQKALNPNFKLGEGTKLNRDFERNLVMATDSLDVIANPKATPAAKKQAYTQFVVGYGNIVRNLTGRKGLEGSKTFIDGTKAMQRAWDRTGKMGQELYEARHKREQRDDSRLEKKTEVKGKFDRNGAIMRELNNRRVNPQLR